MKPDLASRGKQPTKKSFALVFAMGAMMLVLPLAFVLSSSPQCAPISGPMCSETSAYKFGISLFPYVMLAGGLIIGYNMKRIADSLKPPARPEEDFHST